MSVLSNRRCWLLTHTHGAALAIHKWRTGTGHWRAGDLVTNYLGLLPSMNIKWYIRYMSFISIVNTVLNISIWLGSTWQVHLVQLSTTQSSLSSNSRPSCQHMFFSFEFFILPRTSFMTVFSSVWTYKSRKVCSQKWLGHAHDNGTLHSNKQGKVYTCWQGDSFKRAHVKLLFHLVESGIAHSAQVEILLLTLIWLM